MRDIEISVQSLTESANYINMRIVKLNGYVSKVNKTLSWLSSARHSDDIADYNLNLIEIV